MPGSPNACSTALAKMTREGHGARAGGAVLRKDETAASVCDCFIRWEFAQHGVLLFEEEHRVVKVLVGLLSWKGSSSYRAPFLTSHRAPLAPH